MSDIISGIHHVSMKCSGSENFDKTVSFYRDILGLSVKRSWGDGDGRGIMLDAGNGLIEIFASGSASENTGSVNHFAFAVDDTDAAVSAIKNAGYKITLEPKDIEIPSEPPFPAWIAFCIGPCGEEIELFHEK